MSRTNPQVGDLATFSFDQLGTMIEKASASAPATGGGSLTELDMAKIASMVTRQLHQKTSAEQAQAQRIEANRNEWRNRTKVAISTIVKARALLLLSKTSGIKLKPEVEAQIPGLLKQAMAEEEALMGAVSEGAEAKDAVMEDLLEAAAADPEIAAALIGDHTGEEVAAEDVDGAADPLAEVMLDEQLGPVEGETKESAFQKRSSVIARLEQTDPFVKVVLSYRASYKVSQVLQKLDEQRRAAANQA
jgi:hypothetical protein